MNERTPSPVEKFLTEGEVMPILERFFEGANFTEIERDEREGRLVSLTFEGVDSEGDRMLYEYYAFNHGVVEPVVRVVFHDSEGIPCGGHNVANYQQGAWRFQA